jgi:hypothetical protein
MEKPSNKSNKYLLTIIKIQVKVKAHIIKTNNGFLNTPLSPAINGIHYPLIIYKMLEIIRSNLL